MRILLAQRPAYIPTLGGANKANRYLAADLVARGHTVAAVTSALGANNAILGGWTVADLLRYLAEAGAGPHAGPESVDFTLAGVSVHAVIDPARLPVHLAAMIAAFRPDWVLVSSEDGSQSLLAPALEAAPERVVFLAHTVAFLPFGPLAFFPSASRTEIFSRVAGIIAVSHFVQGYIRRWGAMDATTIHFPAYGVGPFPNLGCFDRGFVTLINPSQGKGIEVFLALARRFPQLPFAAVPTWGATAADRAALAELPNIHLLAADENIEHILAQTRILLMPSTWPEGFALTIVEAMLRGIPVLASKIGGNAEALLDAGNLLPVQPITGFSDALDERGLPIAFAPPQPEPVIDRWAETLAALLAERSLYERQSAAAYAAANAFVSRLSAEPFIDYLNQLGAAPQMTPPPPATTPPGLDSRLAAFTPEQRAVLMQRLSRPR